jgi:SAM-dependent methyltransferase
MNFTELIRLNNQLQDLDFKDLNDFTDQKYQSIVQRTDVPLSGVSSKFAENITNRYKNVEAELQNLDQSLQELKTEVQLNIEKEGVRWLQRSYDAYERQLETKDGQQPHAVGLHRNKPIRLDKELEQLFHARVSANCDWHYPAMIIHPMLETFIHDMAGSDPLYLIDESHYLLEPTLSQFNGVYKNRLRPYVIEESFDQPLLLQMPDNQFGFCLVYNYLNYRPYEMIKKYISEIYQKLTPGGILTMTYNDCDRYQAMESVEQYITCYTPGSLIKSWASYVGFEKFFEHRNDGASVWIEFKKPGKQQSLRGGQCLAKIVSKTIAKSK